MKENFNRRQFLKTSAAAGMGISLSPGTFLAHKNQKAVKELKAGIIGLDTSHSIAFTQLLNDPDAAADLAGVRVVAAYPKGSEDIESSVSRIPGYTEEIRQWDVEIVGSIEELLDKVDVVLLETNDGRSHLEQAMPVFKAGKPVFIDKPIAASLSEAIALFERARQYKVPMFSASSLRYMESAQATRQGKTVGKVLGAEAYSPAHLEKTHPDLFWYGVHGVETLFTVMGTGCRQVSRTQTKDTELVVGTWEDGRIGTFRGLRSGKADYGGTAFGEEGITTLGPYGGYRPLLVQIVRFFQTGKAPVAPEETLEIFAFMEAADESKRQGGKAVSLEDVMVKARETHATHK